MLVDTRSGCWADDDGGGDDDCALSLFEVADFFLRFFLPSPLPM